MRADARRNHERIVAVAAEIVAEQGAEASLEEIARRAGVGSATLHRHFPGRQPLLEAVFRGHVERLCALAADLPPDEPRAALATWLRAVGDHAVRHRGLATALMRGAGEEFGASCHTMIIEAGSGLLERARASGAVRPDATLADLLALVSAVAAAAETDPDGPARTARLVGLALDGVWDHAHDQRPDGRTI